MSLHANALITVDELLEYLKASKSDYQIPFLKIYNSSGDATDATVQVTDTTIVLIVTGGANASSNTLTFADVDKDTLTELATAITGLAKGWVVNLEARGDEDSSNLAIIPATSCLLVANELTLNGFNELYLEMLINSASLWIQTIYLGRNILSAVYANEYHDGDGGEYLILKNWPVTVLTKVAWYDHYSASEVELTENTDFIQYPDEGELHKASGWSPGHRNYRITYTAGYATVPEEVKYACKLLCEFSIDMHPGAKSIRISDYAITYRDDDVPAEVKNILYSYKRINI